MREIVTALEQAADLIAAIRLVVSTLQISAGAPARFAGLNLINLYLIAAGSAVDSALAVAKRL